MEFNFFKFRISSSDSNLNGSHFQSRIGSTANSYTLDYLNIEDNKISTSDYHKKCWWTLVNQNVSITQNDTTFAYSNTESNISGLICTLESIAGSILTFLLIVALLKNNELRKEYMTKTIVSIAITDFLFCVFFLPVMSLHYFARYCKKN